MSRAAERIYPSRGKSRGFELSNVRRRIVAEKVRRANYSIGASFPFIRRGLASYLSKVLYEFMDVSGYRSPPASYGARGMIQAGSSAITQLIITKASRFQSHVRSGSMLSFVVQRKREIRPLRTTNLAVEAIILSALKGGLNIFSVRKYPRSSIPLSLHHKRLYHRTCLRSTLFAANISASISPHSTDSP
jgi:hypothetical protein